MYIDPENVIVAIDKYGKLRHTTAQPQEAVLRWIFFV